MVATAEQHHAQDVGKILLQAQEDLRGIREQLAGDGAGAEWHREHLQQVVEKAEAELKLKAEAVLNTVVHGAATLPSLGSYNFRAQSPAEMPPLAGPPRPALQMPARRGNSAGTSRPAAAAAARQRHANAVLNPNGNVGGDSRGYLAQRFGIAAPTPSDRNTAIRPMGRSAVGKLKKERTSSAFGVLERSARRDPGATPPIGPRDVAAGLCSLVQRGLVPGHVDLTPALARHPSPVLQAPSKMHPHKEQFAPHSSSAYVSPFGFNVSNTKLDLLSDVGPTLAEKKAVAQAAASAPRPTVVQPAPVEIGAQSDLPEPPSPRAELPPPADARGFEELMDEFSLHHYIVRNGTTLDSTPEFVSFQRKFAAHWGAVQQLVLSLEAIMRRFAVPLAYVDGAKLAALALDPLADHAEPALLDCLVNREQVAACMARPGQRFRSAGDAKEAAAVEIQAGMRMALGRRRVARLRSMRAAAIVLTRKGKAMAVHAAATRQLQERAEAQHAAWKRTTAKFHREWPRIKGAPRVIIHLPSLSFSERQRRSVENLEVRQNSQMPRLCDVKEPGVDVMYVAPFPLNDDVAHYFSKVLEIGGVDEPQKRYKVVVPENYHRFPSQFSLTSLLLYSPRALRRIANYCRGKPAYIVPNVVGPEELRLSMALGIPLLAPEPRVAALFGSKSGAKRIFHAAQVNVPPGAHDLYDEPDLLGALAQLIAMHLDVPRWVFKLDDEFGGRGHAHLDVAALPCYAQLLREHDQAPEEWEDEAVQARVQQRVVAELLQVLPQRAVINMRWLWRTWADFVAVFQRAGGVVEASPLEIRSSPSANLLVEPDGTVNLTSAHEQIFSSAYTFVGAAFPQTAVPFPALREAALAVGRACYQRNIIGHVGVDFVSFLDHEGLLRVWAVDLNLRLTHSALTFGFFHFLVNGQFDAATGLYHAPPGIGAAGRGGELQQRCYVMNELLFHPQLFAVHHSAFFNLCRLKGVSFDLQERTGTVFNLMDSFVGGVLGILTVGTTLLDALRKFADCLDFIQKQVGPATTKSTTQSNEVSFKDVIKAIKQLVDTQVGNSKPLALPRAAAVEAAEPPLPAAPPPQQRALDVPEKSYLGYRGR